MKKSLFLPALLAILFVLAACRLDSHTVFSTPQSGTFKVVMAMTEDEENIVKQATQMGAEQLCNQFKSEIDAPGAKVDFTKKGKEKICTITAPFKSIDELKKLYGEDVTIHRIAEENGKFYYDVDVTSSNGSDASSLGLNIQSTWQVTMPGKVISSNGDKVKGNTVIWNMPTSGSRHLTAVSKIGGSSVTLIIVILVVFFILLLIAAAVVAWLVMKNKKQQMPQPPMGV